MLSVISRDIDFSQVVTIEKEADQNGSRVRDTVGVQRYDKCRERG